MDIQKTTTIKGKRYDARRVIRDLCGIENKAGNYWLDDAHEIQVRDSEVIIRPICGPCVILSR